MKGFYQRKVKYVLPYLLSFLLLVGLFAPVQGVYAKASDGQGTELGSVTDYNEAFDSYEAAKDASDKAMEAAGETPVDPDTINDEAAMVDAPTLTSVRSAGEYLRECMVDRDGVIFMYVKKGGYDYEDGHNDMFDDIFDIAMEETANAYEGDYLYWNWAAVDGDVYDADDCYYYALYFDYFSTASQEAAVDAEVERILNNELSGWEDQHDAVKTMAAQYLVMETVEYDYYFTNGCFSTYGALIEGSAVCQGYATAMYRLLREMEISTRVVTSETVYDENGDMVGGHAWNIVQMGQYYYNIDATWDDYDGLYDYDFYYFLTCMDTFEDEVDHLREYPYNTAEFYEEYPMGPTDYYIDEHEDEISVKYKTHVQSYGWQSYMCDGFMSGTSGESKRLEGIQIKLANNYNEYDLGVTYRTHIQGYGWEEEWRTDDEFSGTSGESKRLEAIQIDLTGADKDKYNIWYRVHAQNYGWLGWAKNGQPAGTAGQSKRLEGIEILVLPVGEYPDGLIGYSYVDYGLNSTSENKSEGLVNYRTHVQNYGWQGFVFDGSISGTSGKSKRLEGIEIALGDTGYEGGIRYTTHVQTYGWQGDKDKPETWVKDGAMSGTEGESKRLEGIRIELYGEVAEHYDVYYRVHAQTYGWLDWAKNGADAGTAGLSRRLEAIQIVLVPKGGEAPGSTATPFIQK